jgi:hypothetical protein
VVRRPPAKRREVQHRPHHAGADETILALNDLNDVVAFKRCEQQLPVGVVSRLDDHPRQHCTGHGAREPPGVEQVDVLRDGAQSVLGEQRPLMANLSLRLCARSTGAIACASVLTPGAFLDALQPE